MGWYEDQIVPRCVSFALDQKPIRKARQRITQGLRGEVLEVGFGSGLNLPYLPAEVSRLYAIDPSAVGRKLARKRLDACSIPVVFSGLDGQALPLPSESVDAVLSTFTFCTIPDLPRALAEVRRVLRPGGVLHFLEHGLFPDPRVAKWQTRLSKIQRRLAGGCELDRPIAQRIRDAGFRIEGLDNYNLPGPRPMGYMYEGRALRADA